MANKILSLFETIKFIEIRQLAKHSRGLKDLAMWHENSSNVCQTSDGQTPFRLEFVSRKAHKFCQVASHQLTVTTCNLPAHFCTKSMCCRCTMKEFVRLSLAVLRKELLSNSTLQEGKDLLGYAARLSFTNKPIAKTSSLSDVFAKIPIHNL